MVLAASESSSSGTLYIVATPIGNLDDLTPRAARILREVDLIAAEDTRHSARLLQEIDVRTPVVALHEHNEREKTEAIIERLRDGKNVALISDAGTPLISDPGYVLVREARLQNLGVSPIPGVCAITAALSAAGLPTDRFVFEGFLPAKQGSRLRELERIAAESATLVLYEAPHRIKALLEDAASVLGDERQIVLARELTKSFETFYSGSLAEVGRAIAEDPYGDRGEFVVMIHGCEKEDASADDQETDRVLQLLMSELPVKKVAKLASQLTGRGRNELYQRALALKS